MSHESGSIVPPDTLRQTAHGVSRFLINIDVAAPLHGVGVEQEDGMAFVNERVSEQDVEKYGLRAINASYGKGDFDYRWTIDRERDIYLRWMTYDREDIGRNDFSFCWKGALIPVRLYGKGEGVRGGKGSTTWKFGGWTLPEALQSQKDQVVADLKEALVAFKDFGVGSVIADHTAYFDF